MTLSHIIHNNKFVNNFREWQPSSTCGAVVPNIPALGHDIIMNEVHYVTSTTVQRLTGLIQRPSL